MDQVQQLGLFRLLGQAVAQDDDVQRAVGISVAVGGCHRRSQDSATARLLSPQELDGIGQRFLVDGPQFFEERLGRGLDSRKAQMKSRRLAAKAFTQLKRGFTQ